MAPNPTEMGQNGTLLPVLELENDFPGETGVFPRVVEVVDLEF